MPLKKRGWILTGLAVFIAVWIVCFIFDPSISKFVVSLRSLVLNKFFLGVSFVDNEIILGILLGALMFFWKEKREWIIPLWLSMILTAFVSFILKYSIQRQRPFAQGIVTLLPGIADKASYHTWDFSFPSFDTAFVFAVIPLVWKFFPKFRYIWIAFSILVGFSRIYFGVHFLSDVLAGGLIGYLTGKWVIYMETKSGNLRRISHKIFGK